MHPYNYTKTCNHKKKFLNAAWILFLRPYWIQRGGNSVVDGEGTLLQDDRDNLRSFSHLM